MNLVNYEPFKAMSRLQDEINQLFQRDGSFSTNLGEFGAGLSDWTPSVDVKDEENRFLVSADIPGVDPKDIEVHTDNGVLTIKGERRSEQKHEENGLHRTECQYGSFIRRFTLPENADTDNITANGKNGVLEIAIAKKAASAAKRIEIKST